jgi:putative tryptophan/tyrosine transport system substrate-binding protein
MRRRTFIAALGGAAAWPVVGRAQRSDKPVVGFLNTTDMDYRVAAFGQGLKEQGYVDSQNVVIEYRWAQGEYARLPTLASDLVSHKVDVIAATGGIPSARAAKAATTAIPIVFTIASDPVRAGLVANLNRPGRNLTGVTFMSSTLTEKQLEILHEMLPQAAAVGLLVNPSSPLAEFEITDAQAAADATGHKLVVQKATTDGELAGAFDTLLAQRVAAVLVSGDALYNNLRNHLIALANRSGVPAIYSYREFAAAGGLMSYGASVVDAYRLAGVYTGRILKGERAGDLPVQQSTKIELVINLKTAKALGLNMPPSLLARADEVIE